VRVTGIWSHLACADEPAHPANGEQEEAFRAAVATAAAGGLQPEVVHLANSAAALTRPTARFDLVRCGLATYGLSPVPGKRSAAQLGLRPAMTARARVAVVKRVPAGTGVSYGHAYVTERETTLAVVPVGYADGVLRSGSSALPVQVAGRRHTVAGRVCMDQVVVDVGDDPVADGDTVVLFGPGDEGEPTAQDWAEACRTISYEVVTRMGGRFTRRHLPPGRTGSEDVG
jgi:alanine racemase